jgi:hypothetical protein
MITIGLAMAACGGAKKDKAAGGDDPRSHEPVSAVGNVKQGGAYCPPEKFDQIEEVFKAKQKTVLHCYMNGLDRGEVTRSQHGRVTVQLTITGDGKPKDVVISDDQLKCETVCKCVVDLVKGWEFPDCGNDIPYTYAYQFEP